MKNFLYILIVFLTIISPVSGQRLSRNYSSRHSTSFVKKSGQIIKMRVTAYSPNEGSIGGGHQTSSGRSYKLPGVAVDPRIIPIGSTIYIPGYGLAIADDTGGAIKGNHIDVRFSSVSEMKKWGTKRLAVYIIKR